MELPAWMYLSPRWTQCGVIRLVVLQAAVAEALPLVLLWTVAESAEYWAVMYFEVGNAEAGVAAFAAGCAVAVVAVKKKIKINAYVYLHLIN